MAAPAYDPATGEFLRGAIGRAVEVADFDPAYAARVRDELHAGPITPERLRAAVRELAGVGAKVEIRLQTLEEVDFDSGPEWWGAGWLNGRAYTFPVGSQSGPAMRATMDAGDPVIVYVPPTELIDLPDGLLDPPA